MCRAYPAEAARMIDASPCALLLRRRRSHAQRQCLSLVLLQRSHRVDHRVDHHHPVLDSLRAGRQQTLGLPLRRVRERADRPAGECRAGRGRESAPTTSAGACSAR